MRGEREQVEERRSALGKDADRNTDSEGRKTGAASVEGNHLRGKCAQVVIDLGGLGEKGDEVIVGILAGRKCGREGLGEKRRRVERNSQFLGKGEVKSSC